MLVSFQTMDIHTSSFCTGNADNCDIPSLEAGKTGGSDLSKILDRYEFICGYVAYTFYLQSLSFGHVLLDTTDPDNVDGSLVDWQKALRNELGRMYDTVSFAVKWNGSLATSQEGRTEDLMQMGSGMMRMARKCVALLRTKDYCATAQDKMREFLDGTVTCGGNDRALELCGMTK